MPEPVPEPSKPPSPGHHVLRNVAGALLLLAGITDLFLPVLQSLLMIVGGLVLIDLPIKGKVHRWLLRYAFYRRLAQRGDALLAGWRRRR